jgi:penicillin-binding protein 1A
VLQGGLSVYTTLDLEAQSAAHETLYDPTTGYLPSPANPDAALVSIEPETGHITAMVGDRDEGSAVQPGHAGPTATRQLVQAFRSDSGA